MTPTDVLRAEIRRLRSQLITEAGDVPASVRLYDLSRAIDAFCVVEYLSGRRSSTSREDRLRQRTVLRGANVALGLVQTPDAQFEDPRIKTENPQRTKWADLTLSAMGVIARLEYLLSLVHTDLANLVNSGPREMRLIVDLTNAGVEAVERQDLYDADVKDIPQQTTLAEKKKIKELLKRVRDKRLAGAPCVGTHPDISEYFFRVGQSSVRRMLGFEMFEETACFGGVRFSDFKTVIAGLFGLAVEHFHASDNLIGFHRDLLGKRWVLTPVSSIEFLSQQIAMNSGLDHSAVNLVLKALVLSPANVQTHCSIADSTMPPLIAVGGSSVLLSNAGTRGAPLEFLFAELRNNYASDWSIAHQQRERLWRAELYALLPPENPKRFLTSSHGPTLMKDDRVLTDIDAVIFDAYTGTLGLFQFKWQDLFAMNMAKRASIKDNFRRETHEWIERVTEWISSTTPRQMFERFGFKLKLAEKYRSSELFVVGRYSAHFSGERDLDSRSAYATWGQVQRLIPHVGKTEFSAFSEDPIRWLASAIRDDSPFAKVNLAGYQTRREILEINGLRIIVQPEADSAA